MPPFDRSKCKCGEMMPMDLSFAAFNGLELRGAIYSIANLRFAFFSSLCAPNLRPIKVNGFLFETNKICAKPFNAKMAEPKIYSTQNKKAKNMYTKQRWQAHSIVIRFCKYDGVRINISASANPFSDFRCEIKLFIWQTIIIRLGILCVNFYPFSLSD